MSAALANTQIQIDPQDFEFLRAQVLERAGISLNNAKQDLLQSRLRPKVLDLGFDSFHDYRKYLENLPREHSEWQEFINLLTTNKTDWFREMAHFDFILKDFLPRWKKLGKRELKVWSAASSTGEEPYSLSLWLNTHLGPSHSFKIFATDVDTDVLTTARNGVYALNRLEQVPPQFHTHFCKGSGEIADWMKIKPRFKQNVTFEQFNLVTDSPPKKNEFDLILCRNVLIYFRKDTIEKVTETLYQAAAPSASLLIGHSESLNNLKVRWKYVRPSIFIKAGVS